MIKYFGILTKLDSESIAQAIGTLEYYGYNVECLKRESGEEVKFSAASTKGDQITWCQTCRKFGPSRFNPSPDAGPFWRCSECGDICGNIERLNK